MKYIIGLVLFLSIFSCNINNPSYPELHTPNNFPQKWELVQMSFPSENKQQKGLKMAWQESYLLLPDSTFLKKRMTATETITAEGKFYTEKQNDDLYIHFEFNEKSKTLDSSSFTEKERLLFSTEEDKMTLISMQNGKKQILDYQLK
ncbi:hypothetical protein [Zunongwangia atlantica]|nr:hypothetical protein [Zunongwangia atlantica]